MCGPHHLDMRESIPLRSEEISHNSQLPQVNFLEFDSLSAR